jgi:hypothetical protein
VEEAAEEAMAPQEPVKVEDLQEEGVPQEYLKLETQRGKTCVLLGDPMCLTMVIKEWLTK